MVQVTTTYRATLKTGEHMHSWGRVRVDAKTQSVKWDTSQDFIGQKDVTIKCVVHRLPRGECASPHDARSGMATVVAAT